MSQDHSFQVLTKCRITMHKNKFLLLLNDMKRKLLACFYPLKVLCNTSFVSTINFLHSSLFFLLHINVIYLGYFSKIKEIMNVNRRIILVSNICYDKIDDYGQLCAFQGRIQDFHLGGGGGAKGYVPARTLRARHKTQFRQGSRGPGPLKGPGSSRVVLMLSRVIWALFLSILKRKKIGLKKHSLIQV